MKTIVLFLVGSPAAGKTTLVRHLLGDLGSVYLVPKPKWTVGELLCAAGHYTGGTFDGADTVPYGGVKDALAYWLSTALRHLPLTILDGDRFSYADAKTWFESQGARVLCTRLDASAFVLAERRELRGSKQNAAWMKGRETKAQRFFESFDEGSRLQLDATDLTPLLAKKLKVFLDRERAA